MIPDSELLAQRGNGMDMKYRQTTKWTMAVLSGLDKYFTHLSQHNSLLTWTSELWSLSLFQTLKMFAN